MIGANDKIGMLQKAFARLNHTKNLEGFTMPKGNFIRKPRAAFIPIGPSIAYLDLGHDVYALIAIFDVDRVNHIPWHSHASSPQRIYARATWEGKKIYLHRFLHANDDLKVDHKNGCGLNNLPHNLRRATHAENVRNSCLRSQNTSGFKGVTWNKRDGNWTAQIVFNYKRKFLGNFSTPEAAHAAYCEAAARLHGEFARTS